MTLSDPNQDIKGMPLFNVDRNGTRERDMITMDTNRNLYARYSMVYFEWR